MRETLLILILTFSLLADSDTRYIELGIRTSIINYTERNNQDQILDTEQSSLFDIGGLYLSYLHPLGQYSKEAYDVEYFLNLYASVSYGNTDYTGSYLASNAPYGSVSSTTFNSYYELQTNIKRITHIQTRSHYFILGLGYKEWQRELSLNQLETYHYYYAQIVYGIEKSFGNNLKLGLEIGMKMALNPQMDADYTTNASSLQESFDLGTTYTNVVAIPFSYKMNSRISFSTKAEYELTNIGKSNAIYVPDFPNSGDNYSFLEPDSQERSWHLYAGIQYGF